MRRVRAVPEERRTQIAPRFWIAVTAKLAEPPADWSPLADAFVRHGCPSTLQADRPASIAGYLEETGPADRVVSALTGELWRLGAESVAVERVPDDDWSVLWKRHFKPQRIGNRLVVRPTWESCRLAAGEIEIVLDPGQAFGTGDHPTTRMCLILLEQEDPEGRSVLDVGCGSGILSIAAAKLGARKAVGLDIDPSAVSCARRNAQLNAVAASFRVADGFAHPAARGAWDIVVSNIISATLIRLAYDAHKNLAPQGCWLVSGVIRANWPEIRQAAEEAGLVIQTTLEEGDWIAATLRKARVG